MTSPYRVELDVNGVAIASQDGDPAAYGLADPLELKFSIPNADLAPLVQQDPAEATVNVIAPDATTYAFKLGDPVRATVYADHSGGNNYAFFGRIAQLTAQPHKLGILYTLTCVDYLADLAELKAGRVDYPQEPSLTRVNRMLAENGMGPVVVEGIVPVLNPNASARVAATEGVVPLDEALEEVLAGWIESQTVDEVGGTPLNTITCRYELRPNIVNPGGVAGQGSLDPSSPFKLTPIYRPQGWAAPGRLSLVPNAHVTVDVSASSPATQALVLDAGAVDFAPTFVQQKGNAITRVVVQADGVGFALADWAGGGSYSWQAASSALEATVKTRLVDLATIAVACAAMYRGWIQPDPAVSWVVGTMTWRASRTQAAGWQGPQLRRLCTVARVDAVNSSSHVPTGRKWITGVVDSLRVLVAGGEVTVGFTVSPMPYLIQSRRVATFLDLDLVGRVNMSGNPAAALGTGGWSAVGAGVTMSSFAAAHPAGVGGTQVFRGIGTTTGADTYMLHQIGGTKPNTLYRVNMYRFIPAALTGAAIGNRGLWVNDSTGASPGSSSMPVGSATGVWVREQVTVTTTAGHTGVLSVRCYVPNGTVYWVGLLVEELGASGAAYFDGDTPDAAGVQYDWGSTPGASYSTGSTLTFAGLDPTDTFADYTILDGSNVFSTV